MKHFLRTITKRMRIALGLLLCVLILCESVPSVAFAEASEPSQNAQASTGDAILSGGPSIEAAAAVVMEVYSGAVLYSKNSTESHSPTSLTKLMTGLLAFEHAGMNDTVSCSYQAIHGIGSKVTRVGLEEDERMAVSDMLYAIMVASADEASYALGEEIGGTMKNFLSLMNSRMASLGGINTTFTSATGTDNTKQLSCAYDLGLIACELAHYPAFMKMASSKWYELPATNLNDARIIAQTHKFIRQTLTYEYAKAGKSGGVASDGTYSLCTYAEKDGMTLVAIVLGSPNDQAAYDDSVSILNYSFENYEVFSMKEAEGEISDSYTGLFTSCPMFSQSGTEIVYNDDNAAVVLPLNADLSQVTKSIEYFELPEYVHGENVIGCVRYRYMGQQVGKSNIIFFNKEFPMSQEEFDAVWPLFLIPPSSLASQGGTGLPTVTPVPEAPNDSNPNDANGDSNDKNNDPNDANDDSNDKKSSAKILAIVISSVIFLLCLAGIYVAYPYYRRKKNRQRTRL